MRISGLIISAVCSVLMISAADYERIYAESFPEPGAKAAVLAEASTGRVIYEKNSDEKLSMASTTKIMTVLLCLESGDLDEEFTVDPEAIKVEGSSMGLREGDVVSKRDLCIGMLLPSGNDAANAAAVKIAGNIKDFAVMMNKRAQEIGMTRSCFVTPSGLEAPGHGTSAHDMFLLAREALKNEDFRAICSQKSMKLTFGNPPYERWLKNTNRLLSEYDGVNGVKTGFTDEAGKCLISSCERNGVSLICVTLNDPNDRADHAAMYDYGFAHTVSAELPAGEHFADVAGGKSEKVSISSGQTIPVGVIDGEVPELTEKTYIVPFLYAPVKKGTYAGYTEYYCDGVLVCRHELYTDVSVEADRGNRTVFQKISDLAGKIIRRFV